MTKYGVLVGSLRKNSHTLGLAEAIIAGLPEDAEVTMIDIANLPLYNADYDADSPAAYTVYRDAMREQDAIIIATPEHNRNVPAALKNALDVGSRPFGESVWAGKIILPASQSIGNLSGLLANHSLRQSLDFLDTTVMTQPEVYIAKSKDLSDENGKITNEGTQKFLASVGQDFDAFVKTHLQL